MVKELARGITAHGRSKAYHRRGLWAIKKKNDGKFPVHEKKEKAAEPVAKVRRARRPRPGCGGSVLALLRAVRAARTRCQQAPEEPVQWQQAWDAEGVVRTSRGGRARSSEAGVSLTCRRRKRAPAGAGACLGPGRPERLLWQSNFVCRDASAAPLQAGEGHQQSLGLCIT
jgi:hypothetical protein